MGIAILDRGKRKQTLLQAAEIIFIDFSDRCLPFDKNTTNHYANIIAFAKINGRPISVEDAQIAATAIQNNALLATRNTTDFDFLENLKGYFFFSESRSALRNTERDKQKHSD